MKEIYCHMYMNNKEIKIDAMEALGVGFGLSPQNIDDIESLVEAGISFFCLSLEQRYYNIFCQFVFDLFFFLN